MNGWRRSPRSRRGTPAERRAGRATRRRRQRTLLSRRRAARSTRRDARLRRAARRRRRVASRSRRARSYAILGSNGAGKTTLFNAITGDFPPTAGRIHFFGEDITELPPHERIRKGLRRTYQSSLLFRDLSVRDNLFLAVRGVAQRALQSFRAARGACRRTSRPTICSSACACRTSPTQPVADLAHGQQRQLEIGMALAGAPRLILFDEPAAGLSPGRAARAGRAAPCACRRT